jgi:hypothetical protein
MTTTRSDWQAVAAAMNEKERQTLGAPPTAEELLAYSNGELSPAEEEHVRALLVAYPELAEALAQEFPEEGAAPGQPGYVSPAEIEAGLDALRPAARGKVVTFWRRTALALAALLVLAFGGLLWELTAKARLARELGGPRVAWESQLLLPDGRRGRDGATTLTADGESYLLVAPLYNQPHYPDYRLDFVDLSGADPRVMWSRTGLQRRDDDTFVIVVPRAFLPPGRYQVIAYGLGHASPEKLMTYTLKVADR